MAIRRLQPAAWTIAVVFGLLALSTSTGCPVIEPLGSNASSRLVAFCHVLVIGVGVTFGLLTMARAREIDRERWRVVDDSALTSGEREYAHREAESSKRAVGVTFVLAPMALGLWLAYQLKGEELGAADFLTITPLFGFGIGLALGWLALRHGAPSDPQGD